MKITKLLAIAFIVLLGLYKTVQFFQIDHCLDIGGA